EADRQGASFVVKPLENPQFLDLVRGALLASRATGSAVRRWPRKRASSDIRVRAGVVDARILDLSYGGLKLGGGGDEGEMPSAFDVTREGTDIRLRAHRIWTGRSSEQIGWWGVEFAEVGPTAAASGRAFVDAAD